MRVSTKSESECLTPPAGLKSPGEKHIKTTRRRLVYRDNAARGDWASRCRHSENRSTSRGQAKNFRICLMTTKVVSSSPICESAVVDLVDLVMSRNHQNDNAVWLCRRVTKEKKKVESNKRSGAERIWTDDHPGLQSQRSKPPGYLGIDDCVVKKIHGIMVTARERSILGQEKVCGVLLTKLD